MELPCVGLSIKQVADILGCSRDTIERNIEAFPNRYLLFKDSGPLRIPVGDVEAVRESGKILAQNRVPKQAERSGT